MRWAVLLLTALLSGCGTQPPTAIEIEFGPLGDHFVHFELKVLVAPETWESEIPSTAFDIRYAETTARGIYMQDKTSNRFISGNPSMAIHVAWSGQGSIPPLTLASINATHGTVSWGEAWYPVFASPDPSSDSWAFMFDDDEWAVQRESVGQVITVEATSGEGRMLHASMGASGMVQNASLHQGEHLIWSMAMRAGDLLGETIYLKDTQARKLVEITGTGGNGRQVKEAPMGGPSQYLYAAYAMQCETDPMGLEATRIIGPSIDYISQIMADVSVQCGMTVIDEHGFQIWCPSQSPDAVRIEADPGMLPWHNFNYQASAIAVDYDILELTRTGETWSIEVRQPTVTGCP